MTTDTSTFDTRLEAARQAERHASYTSTFNFYREVCQALKREFDSLGVEFRDEPNLVQGHMNTPTPTFFVLGVGYVCWDKSMVCPARYFSLYTGITGGWGANGQHRKATVEWVVRVFKLMHTLKSGDFDQEAVLAEAAALGIREDAVRHYFARGLRCRP